MHALKNASGRKALAGTLGFFGFRAQELRDWQQRHAPAPARSESEIETRIGARNAARAAKNWAESDRIRDELAVLGIKLTDSKDGTTWEMAR
jgi:cysteinyl-tRNA synthetase